MKNFLITISCYLLFSCNFYQEDNNTFHVENDQRSIENCKLILNATFMDNKSPSIPEDKTKYILSIQNNDSQPCRIITFLNSGYITNDYDSLRLTIHSSETIAYTKDKLKIKILDPGEKTTVFYEDCLTPATINQIVLTYDIKPTLGKKFKIWSGQLNCIAYRNKDNHSKK